MLLCACDSDIGWHVNIGTFTKPAEVSDDSVGSAPNVRPQLVIAGIAVATGGQGTRAPAPDAAAL